MGDGMSQTEFYLPLRKSISRLRPNEIVVDLFAGGGGASEALRRALGRDPDIAINHDRWAIGMHAANHPFTRHLQEDVWHADPAMEVGDRLVGWLHASPDCTHFSQAKGGQPRSKATRSLSWVVAKWAGTLRKRGRQPRLVSLENVVQILKWGPLIAKRDPATGRVLTLEMETCRVTGRKIHRVAAPGERVPVQNQYLVPDPKRAGQTWRHFVRVLEDMGYQVEWRRLTACDYGAGTSRTRLFMLARCDGEEIRWPAATHGPGREHPYVTAADCIDWSVDCPSIFTRKKALATATLRRIGRGIRRYVLDAHEPFIIQCANTSANGVSGTSTPLGTVTAWPRGGSHAVCMPTLVHATHGGDRRAHGVGEPMPTITAAHRGEMMVVAPSLIQTSHGEGAGATARRGSGAHDIREPVGTIHAGGGSFAVMAPTLIQTGYGERPGQAPRVPGLDKPLGTFVDGQKHAVVGAHLVKFRGESAGSSVQSPMPTITSGAGAARPAGAPHALGLLTAFLEQANGGFYTGAGNDMRSAVPTITGTGSQQRLVAAHLTAMAQNVPSIPADSPLPTMLAGATRYGAVECHLTQNAALRARVLDVARFLRDYAGLVPTDDSEEALLALAIVDVEGIPHLMVDIGLRMLRRQELFKAQGFDDDYIIDRIADGTPLSISRSVKMVGNSVSPPPLEALALANLDASDAVMRKAA